MNRRAFLWKSAATSLSSTILGGCATARQPFGQVQPIQTAPNISLIGNACGLPPVHVSESREIRTVAGLRPYRPSGFVVRPERLGDTLVVHNYGHGGGGITLSSGTSKLAVDIELAGYRGQVAVLGSGAVGLATARLVQEAGLPVTIYTKALPPETTSNIAGGQWLPVSVVDTDKQTPQFDEQFLAAAQFAYKRYQIMTGPRFGVRWMRNYFPSNDGFSESGSHGKDSIIRAMMPEFFVGIYLV
jgi:D-amino-acid oxidase